MNHDEYHGQEHTEHYKNPSPHTCIHCTVYTVTLYCTSLLHSAFSLRYIVLHISLAVCFQSALHCTAHLSCTLLSVCVTLYCTSLLHSAFSLRYIVLHISLALCFQSALHCAAHLSCTLLSVYTKQRRPFPF